MRETRLIMGMPIEIEVVDEPDAATFREAFAYLEAVDRRFSTYKADSEIMRMNRGEVACGEASEAMREVLALAERTKAETGGYFDIRRPDGLLDPSGVVKGWAIRGAAELIRARGHRQYAVNAGGDIATSGENAEGRPWSIGVRNPFATEEIVKVVYPRGRGVATSGSYIRGAHIYNPHAPEEELGDVVSLTVLGPDVLEADRYATAAFAMGKEGVAFIERLPGFEAYAIDALGRATLTSGFAAYTTP